MGPRCQRSPAFDVHGTPHRSPGLGLGRVHEEGGENKGGSWATSPDDMVDHNWVRGQQQGSEALGDLGKLQAGTVKNLKQESREGDHSCVFEETVANKNPFIWKDHKKLRASHNPGC